MTRPMQKNIYCMITVLIFLLLQIVTVQSQSSSDQCSVSTTSNCDPGGIVNYSVSFKYNGDETTLDFYDATIRFHWGGASDYTIGPSSYAPYVEHTKTDSNYYLEENGEYYVGYTVQFDNVSCSRKTYTGYKRVVFRSGSCYFEDFEGTNVPTNGETNVSYYLFIVCLCNSLLLDEGVCTMILNLHCFICSFSYRMRKYQFYIL